MPHRKFVHTFRTGQLKHECVIRIYAAQNAPKPKTVVIVTDLQKGHLTSHVEKIATEISTNEHIKPDELLFVEHAEAHPLFGEETFDIVSFQRDHRAQEFTKPNWRQSSKPEIENIIGESFK